MHKNCDPAVGYFIKWKINHWSRHLTECASLGVSRYSDHFDRLIVDKKTKTAPDCVFVRPKLSDHRFVHDGHPWRILVIVVLGQAAASQEWDSHRLQISWRDRADIGNLTIALIIFSASLNYNGTTLSGKSKRHKLTKIRTRDARIESDLIDN